MPHVVLVFEKAQEFPAFCPKFVLFFGWKGAHTKLCLAVMSLCVSSLASVGLLWWGPSREAGVRSESSWAPGFGRVSITGINTMTKNNLEKKRFVSAYKSQVTLYCWANSRQELKAGTWRKELKQRNTAACLVSIPYTAQGPLPRAGPAHSVPAFLDGLAAPTNLLAGQSNGGSSWIKIPPFQVCVWVSLMFTKLTGTTPETNQQT